MPANELSPALSADEICVLQFLKNWPGDFVSTAEIARRADGKARYQTEPRWAANVLVQLKNLNLVEADGHGKFRLKSVQSKTQMIRLGGKERFVAPHLRVILEKHGQKFALSS